MRVLGMGGADLLKWMMSFGYGVHLLCRDGSGMQIVSDMDLFLADLGKPV
jgi:hypothetical protein